MPELPIRAFEGCAIVEIYWQARRPGLAGAARRRRA